VTALFRRRIGVFALSDDRRGIVDGFGREPDHAAEIDVV
jgi:hypothetical protein